MKTKHLGDKGEALVADYLKKEKFRIIARNYRQRNGEIDLIALRDDMIVFVEVKARTHSSFDLSEVVSTTKQKRIVACARYFIVEHKMYNVSYRFDVALLENLQTGQIVYIKDAFAPYEL
ncbi:MAG TPA: YraN family protein [Candidatus Dependentiae bacterium]|jgi:putative endonuclease|nr:YraN family protein [Candidatus Dependentiae bacterium]